MIGELIFAEYRNNRLIIKGEYLNGNVAISYKYLEFS